MTICDDLKAARLASGLSVDEVASKLKTSVAEVERIERQVPLTDEQGMYPQPHVLYDFATLYTKNEADRKDMYIKFMLSAGHLIRTKR